MENKKNILIVDDEKDILEILSYNLIKENYNVITSTNGADALLKVNKELDLIILDVMMPKMNGYDVCESIKSNSKLSHIPIIFLTAMSSDLDEYKGLKVGADDFVQKPIAIENFLLRIKNILKRQFKSTKMDNISYSGFSLDVDRSILIDQLGKYIKLTKIEFDIVNLLFNSQNRVFNRQEIIDKVWGSDVFITDRSIDVHIRNIRKKTSQNLISTFHGKGYILED